MLCVLSAFDCATFSIPAVPQTKVGENTLVKRLEAELLNQRGPKRGPKQQRGCQQYDMLLIHLCQTMGRSSAFSFSGMLPPSGLEVALRRAPRAQRRRQRGFPKTKRTK